VSVYRSGVVVFGVVFIVLGVAMIVVTALQGFGVGLILGPLFLFLGVARIYLALRRR
jgi:uncharacterized membrane protein HdeD (DUF308 family)